MDDLESRLERELSGLGRVSLAEPEPVADLRRRARRVRVGRVLRTFVAAATAVVVVGAVVVVAGSGSHAAQHRKLSVSAPGFVLGDIDAVVLSSGFDADGARNPVPPALAETVAHVPGVQSVSGVIDTFAPVVSIGGTDANFYSNGSATTPLTIQTPQVPPRSPILFSYHRDDEVHIVEGRSPSADDEIVVDADFLTRNHTAIGKKVTLQVKGQMIDFHIVGTFDLPGVDLAGIPLAALSAAHQPSQIQLDRIDVNLAPTTDRANVRDAIAVAVGNAYTVAEPSAISFADQRLAQVEIQHAYWALLSPDTAERTTSGVGKETVQEHTNYEKYASLAKEVELRVENVTFLSPDAASLTFRIYYGGGPSPIINEPQTGNATRVEGHWQLGTSTLCSLAALVGITCKGADHLTIHPPNGYEPLSTLDPEIMQAFTALANPDATVDQRVAAVTNGASLRAEIEAGAIQDRSITKSELTVAGWRSISPTAVEILYSLTTTGGPSTPWPSTARAEKAADGHWYASPQFACGINGLASGACFDSSSTGVLGVVPAPVGGVTPTTATATTHP